MLFWGEISPRSGYLFFYTWFKVFLGKHQEKVWFFFLSNLPLNIIYISPSSAGSNLFQTIDVIDPLHVTSQAQTAPSLAFNFKSFLQNSKSSKAFIVVRNHQVTSRVYCFRDHTGSVRSPHSSQKEKKNILFSTSCKALNQLWFAWIVFPRIPYIFFAFRRTNRVES